MKRIIYLLPFVLALGLSAFAQTAADTFDRSDSTSLGTNWTIPSGAGSPAISGNQVVPDGPATYRDCIALWSGQQFPADQFSQVTLTGYSDWEGPIVRSTVLLGFRGEDRQLYLRRGATVLHQYTAAFRLPVVLRLEARGPVYTAYVDGVVLEPVTDPTVVSGQPGLLIFGAAGNSLDNWSGGALAAGGKTVTLGWDPNAESDLAGYKIHWGNAAGQYANHADVPLSTLASKSAPTWTSPALQPGTYYFAATAYNTGGMESGYSNELQIALAAPQTPPAPPANLRQLQQQVIAILQWLAGLATADLAKASP